MARYRRWSASTPHRCSTSSASGPACASRSSTSTDPDIRPLIGERTTDLTEGWPAPDTDVVLLGAESIDDLGRLADLATRISPNGAIWVVSRKGTARTLRDVDVIDAAKASGLVDNKGASFSATHTALRLVIPVALRPRA